jgi:KaiC/GvpD/RAD55 family RecA-like ATPase
MEDNTQPQTEQQTYSNKQQGSKALSRVMSIFVACLFEADDIVEVRRLPSCQSTWHNAADLPSISGALIVENASGQNIYIGANPRKTAGGRKSEDVVLARCLFVDFDNMIIDESLERIKTLPPPTLILISGHGVHCYWRLVDPIDNLITWTELQRDLASYVGSDPTIHDPPRIMRVPGFTNHKPPIAESYIVESDSSRVYHFCDLWDMIPRREIAEPPDNAEMDSKKIIPKNDPLTVYKRAAAYLDRIPRAVTGQNGNTQTYKAACALVKDFGLSAVDALPLLMQWNQGCSPQWTEDELREMLQHALTYGNKKGGCKANEPPTRKGNAALPTDSLPNPPGPEWFTVRDIGNRPTYRMGVPPIATGYHEIDEMLHGGLRPESVYILAGRTGGAKSTLALNIARQVALSGHSVLVFKLEESLIEAVQRLHSAASQVPLNILLDGAQTADKEARDALTDGWSLIRDLPLVLSDARELSSIKRIARAHAEAGGKLIVLDQFSMVTAESAEPGYSLATHVSNSLRILARELRIAILAVAQVNRPASKSKEPLSCNDLRDSGCIENDAAGVILIDGVRKPEGQQYDPIRYLQLSIGKNRYGAITRSKDELLELLWYPKICRIEDSTVLNNRGAA